MCRVESTPEAMRRTRTEAERAAAKLLLLALLEIVHQVPSPHCLWRHCASNQAKCAPYWPRILLVLPFALFSTRASSQTRLATIFGIISDRSGGLIPEVAVTIVNRNTGPKREVRDLTATFNAGFSGHGGGLIEMATRSGTSHLHGSL